MGNTIPDNISYPDGPEQVGRLHQWIKDLAEDVQLAINSLTNQHAVFNCVKTIPSTGDQLVGTPVFDDTLTTNKTFCVPTADGELTIQSPGLYAVSSTSIFDPGGAVATPIYADARVGVLIGIPRYRGSANYPSSRLTSTALPNLRILQPGQKLFFTVQQTSGTALLTNTAIQITKLGRL